MHEFAIIEYYTSAAKKEISAAFQALTAEQKAKPHDRLEEITSGYATTINEATNDAEHDTLQELKSLQAEFGEGVIDCAIVTGNYIFEWESPSVRRS